MNQLGDKAPKANPTLTGTINMNTIEAIPNAENIKPDLNVLQNLKVGTGLAPTNLPVLGNSSIAGNLGVIGVTTLGDDLNVGSAGPQESGFNNDLHVYGDASVTGDATDGDTDVIATIDTKAPIANPSFSAILSASAVDTVPNANNVKPNLCVLQN